MIISHKYKCIFWKPYKVAGSSLIHTFYNQSGEDDIVGYSFPSRYVRGVHKNMRKNWWAHMRPWGIRKIMGEEIFKNYLKFTIIRNPWDLYVSEYWNYYHNDRGIIPPPPDHSNEKFTNMFELGIRGRFLRNRPYWCGWQPDVFLRFENIEDDYKLLCERLCIPHESLAKIKTQYRVDKTHYSEYFTQKTKQAVYDHYDDIIKRFNYAF